jgi:hypothetical protein
MIEEIPITGNSSSLAIHPMVSYLSGCRPDSQLSQLRDRFSQTTHLKNPVGGVNQHYHIPAKSMLYNTGNAMMLASSPLLKIGKVS